jgi:uncharacterized membrane protein YkoI
LKIGDKSMKINRFVALAAIALMVVGAMGAISLKVFAKAKTAPAAQVSQPPDCSQDQTIDAVVKSATDTENIELQCGDQNSSDGQPNANDVYTNTMELQEGDQSSQDGQMSANDVYTDTTQVQQGDQNAPDALDVNNTETEGTRDAETTTLGTPAITVEQAQATALAANPGTTVIKTELDDENGQLIYSVELAGGLDVKLDAMTGMILSTESGHN